MNGIKLQTVVTPLGEVAVALFDTMPTGTAVLFDPSIMAPVHQMVPGKGNFFLGDLQRLVQEKHIRFSDRLVWITVLSG